MRHSARWILAAIAVAAIPACGGAGGGGGGGAAGGTGGALDPLFGLTGAVVRCPNAAAGTPRAAAADETWIFVAGYTHVESLGSNTAAHLEKRSLVTGALDPAFGAGGVVVTNLGAGPDEYHAVAQDGDHLLLAMEDSSPGGSDVQWRIERRRKDTGALDETFGTLGYVTANPTSGYDQPHHLIVSGGSFFVVGGRDGDQHVVIEKRSLSTGDKDPLYASGNSQILGFIPGRDRIGGAVVDSYWLYLADYLLETEGDWRIFRMSVETGELDSTFGTGGLLLINPSAGLDAINAMRIQDGYLYLAGYDLAPGDAQWRLERRPLATLLPDPSFGVQGVIAWNPGTGTDSIATLEVKDGWVYASGVNSSLGGGAWTVRRWSAVDGAPAPAFGAAGIATSDPGPSLDYPTASCIAGGAIFVSGADLSTGAYQWRTERRSLESGALSLAFGTPGKVLRDTNPSGMDYVAATLRSGNHLYVAGVDEQSGSGDAQWRIEKRDAATGRPAEGFGDHGRILVNPGPGFDRPTAMAEAGGWLFIGGLEVALGLERWRIEKRSAVTGQLDPTWPYGGSISWDISPGPDRLWSLRAVGPHLFLAGETQGAQVGEQEWLILKITWSDGLPVAEFGTNGQLQENVGPSGNAPFAMADDGTALYVAGHAGGAWRVEKRDLVTGEFVPEFNGGTVTLDPSPALDIARAIAVADGSLFVGGEQQAPDGYRGWRVQKFDATTGATSMSFGTDGAIVHSAEGFGPDTAARSIVVDGGNLYLGGEVGVLSRLEKRTTDKGKLVPTFGDSGVILGSMRSIYSLALDADSVYAAGHHLEGNNLIEAIEKRTK